MIRSVLKLVRELIPGWKNPMHAFSASVLHCMHGTSQTPVTDLRIHHKVHGKCLKKNVYQLFVTAATYRQSGSFSSQFNGDSIWLL